jgi:hypothetical protein
MGNLPALNEQLPVQDPIILNDYSEPQPDVALLRWRDDFYRKSVVAH